MCFAPQRRAFFRHLNFQKWSEHGVLCTFWLGHALRATTACIFLDISTSKSGPELVCFVHFDFEMCFAQLRATTAWNCSSLASWLRTRRFSEPTFRPSGATHHWKNTLLCDFPTFSRTCINFLLTLSFSDLLSSALLFSILLLHLCFSSVHVVGSLTSKLPSISGFDVDYVAYEYL